MNALNKFIFFFVIFNVVLVIVSVKVCSTWTDYWKFLGNTTCRENLDAADEFAGIITRWGKKVQTFEILTYDGYYLTLFRIVTENENANPVLLLHGVDMNSLAMVNRGHKSLAYQFVTAGYDVWLINWRGTKYSKKHISLSTRNPHYWRFSFHEWGIYDLSKSLQRIRKTNPKKVLIVGFEIGTTAAFVYASEYPDESNENIKAMVSLSPIITPKHAGWFLKWVYYSVKYQLKPLIQLFYHGEVPPVLRGFRAQPFCKWNIFLSRICDAYFNLGLGLDLNQQDPETLPVIVAQNKDSEPVMDYEHISQIMRRNKFLKFDFGHAKNIELYGQLEPPAYNLTKIKIPQLFYVAKGDKYGTVEDTEAAYARFSPEYQKEYYVIEDQNFGQLDFIQAKDVNNLLHKHLMKSIGNIVPPTES